VRFLPLILALLFSGLPLFAQQQERKLEDRILKPNLDLQFNLSKSSSFGNRSAPSKNANVREFAFTQKVAPKEFASKDFGGSKASWFSKLKFFSRNSASTEGKYAIPNASKKADTKTLSVDDAREASKSMDTAQYAKADRPYLIRGRSQDKLDDEKGVPKDNKPLGWGGSLTPMTIDDVRELLNKNK
jgi:hypothetical protein